VSIEVPVDSMKLLDLSSDSEGIRLSLQAWEEPLELGWSEVVAALPRTATRAERGGARTPMAVVDAEDGVTATFAKKARKLKVRAAFAAPTRHARDP
jgi:hypothetical protein